MGMADDACSYRGVGYLIDDFEDDIRDLGEEAPALVTQIKKWNRRLTFPGTGKDLTLPPISKSEPAGKTCTKPFRRHRRPSCPTLPLITTTDTPEKRSAIESSPVEQCVSFPSILTNLNARYEEERSVSNYSCAADEEISKESVDEVKESVGDEEDADEEETSRKLIKQARYLAKYREARRMPVHSHEGHVTALDIYDDILRVHLSELYPRLAGDVSPKKNSPAATEAICLRSSLQRAGSILDAINEAKGGAGVRMVKERPKSRALVQAYNAWSSSW